MPDWLTWLRERGNQIALARLTERLAGKKLHPATISKWANGHSKPDTAAVTLMELVRRNPELLETK